MTSQKTPQNTTRTISKAIFQTMVEKANDGIYVYLDDRFFYVNPAFAKILGYPVRELETKSLSDVVHPRSRDLVEKHYGEQIRGISEPERFDVIFLTRRKQERIISLSPSIITLSGKTAILNIARDITERRRMEDTLESSNQFLNSLIANSSDAIVASDLNGGVLLFNRAAEEITGYNALEMLNQKIKIQSFMKPGERERIMAMLDEGNSDSPRRLIGEETSLFIKDGSLIPISLSVSYVYQGENPVAAVSVFRDLRPLKEFQDKLRESEQKYRILVEKSEDGIFVYQGHRFKYTNPKFRKLLGYSIDELGRMGLKDMVRPELADLIEGRYDKRIRGEKVPEQYEIALADKDGLWRAFEITPSVIEYEGRPATQNVIRDITERREAEKALRASEAKYRATVEHTGTAMMILDDDYTILFANNQMERLSGYAKKDIEGKIRWTELVHADDIERMKRYHKARRSGNKTVPSEYEFRFIDKAGKVRNSFITIGMIPGTRQSIVSIMDITDLKRLERELEQTRKMAILGEMSAHVAHEVRNPLQKIKTGLELLSRSQADEERQKRQMEGVKSGVDKLEKFVTQILDWTRSGQIRPRQYRISNIVDGLVFNCQEKLSASGIAVETSYDPQGDTIVADGVQIRQLMENIIENAIDAMPEGGTLTITTTAIEQYTFTRHKDSSPVDAVEIRVRDTGLGLSQEDLKKLFQPFFTKKTKGTGLGLALVQKVVAIHGGEVTAVSEEGRGAEFIVRLPRVLEGSVDIQPSENRA
ncbi:MAG TPA: PAS domain S-box protein [Deltaproteobacteria bacterium]|nr:PAS domain S-box protein [Deltaproteobacteria bacterium]